MTEITPRQAQAVLDFIDLHPDVWLHIAPNLTCNEAEVFAEVFRVWGTKTQANEFLVNHANGDDDEGDLHTHLRRTDA